MKAYLLRLSAFCLLCIWLLLSVGCAAQPAASTPENTPTPQPIERTEEITIPEEVIDRLDLDVMAAARRLNLTTVTENIDGSCTIHLTTEEKEALISTMQDTLEEALKNLTADGTWPFLIRLEPAADNRSVTLFTEADRYNPSRDRTIAPAVYLPTLLYLAFTGEDTANFVQQFTVLDENTGTELDAFAYPESTTPPEQSPTE